jgi:hypothetical protein
MTPAQPWDRQAVHDELDRVQADFHRLLSQATAASLARRTDGTKWTNEQLLFHMLFGYMIVRCRRLCYDCSTDGTSWIRRA